MYITQYACPKCKTMSVEGHNKDEDIWICLKCGWTGKYSELIPTFSSEHPYNLKNQ